jgi:hypothetical protein
VVSLRQLAQQHRIARIKPKKTLKSVNPVGDAHLGFLRSPARQKAQHAWLSAFTLQTWIGCEDLAAGA